MLFLWKCSSTFTDLTILEHSEINRSIFFQSTVTADPNKLMLEHLFYPQIHNLGMNTYGFLFMQDNVPRYRMGRSFNIVNSDLGTRVVVYQYPNCYTGTSNCPPFAPHMNPSDSYLQGNMKDLVYKKKLADHFSLKNSITDTFSNI